MPVKITDKSIWILSTRFWIAILGFFGFTLMYSQRVGMSVAIVCMVNHTRLNLKTNFQNGNISFNGLATQVNKSHTDENLSKTTSCDVQSGDNGKENTDGPFEWSKRNQGHILGAFFYGYLITQIPFGLLGQRFGGKWMFIICCLITNIGTLLTPLCANTHLYLLLAVRVITGMGSAGMYPIMHGIWGQWSPPEERSRLGGITMAGGMTGNVVAMPVSALLCEYGFNGGWPSIFYVFGGVTSLWLIVWTLTMADTPVKCRYISEREREYITNSLQGQVRKKKKFKTPWLPIAKSPAVWAIVVANFSSDWTLYTMLTNTPTYMYEVMHFDIRSNGFLSALPFLGLVINMNISPIFADKLISNKILSVGHTRKLFNTIGRVGCSVFLIALSFVECNQPWLAVTFLVCSSTINGTSQSGYAVNHMDIAPELAGTLFGTTNCLAATSGFIAPYVAATLTQNQTNAEWQKVFFLSAAISFIGAVFYVIFASGELQPWAIQTDSRNTVAVDLSSCDTEEKNELTSRDSKHENDRNIT